MSIIDAQNLWVVANFKETQVSKIKIGQAVKIKVDACDDRHFTGKIESFAGATGAKFSLLPPGFFSMFWCFARLESRSCNCL